MQPRWGLSAGLCGLMTVGLYFLSANPAQAVSGNGPYYAEPSWSQKLPAATRFVVLTDWNNQAVLDRNTGLVWEQSPQTVTFGWANARVQCANKEVGGQKGWRLPAFAELASLVDPGLAGLGAKLPPGHPFTNVQSTAYWSASTFASEPTLAWFVSFAGGTVSGDLKSSTLPVWCVRGAMNADAY